MSVSATWRSDLRAKVSCRLRRTARAWRSSGRRPSPRSEELRLPEPPHPPELLVARFDALGRRHLPDLVELRREIFVQDRRLPRRISLRPARGLGHDLVDDLQLFEVGRGDAHGARGLLRLALIG